MMDAGIDFLLPCYAGDPYDEAIQNPPIIYSYLGLSPLAQAEQKLRAEGLNPPEIGFFGGCGLGHNRFHPAIDVSTMVGRAWVYVSIRDFFSMIPPSQWAMIDGHPIVFLHIPDGDSTGTWTDGMAQYIDQHFAADFGGATP